jgi:hypothetical protein
MHSREPLGELRIALAQSAQHRIGVAAQARQQIAQALAATLQARRGALCVQALLQLVEPLRAHFEVSARTVF